MRNDLIEKLKDKKTAQAFGLRAPEEQACFRKVSKKNCVMFSDNCWSRAIGGVFVSGTTYAIKPDYQPEPKFVDLEIKEIKGLLGTYENGLFDPLYRLPSLPGFDEFWTGSGDSIRTRRIVPFDDVASNIDEGKKVYARFRGQGQ